MQRFSPRFVFRPAFRLAFRSAALLLVLQTATLSLPVQAQMPGDYRIVNGRVDNGTYLGWRVFHSACHTCHGVDALGTQVAPNLLERVRMMTPRAFVSKVLTSYRIVVPAHESNSEGRAAIHEAMVDELMRQERRARGQIVMPAWEDDPKVSPMVLDVFAYLSARADGKLGPGKPARLGRTAQRPVK